MAVSDQSVATTGTQLDQLCINTIRTLSIDAVQKANSAIPAHRWAGSGRYCLCSSFCATTRRSPLAEPRPFRALQRTRVHAALFPVASGGVRDVAADGKVLSTPAVSLDEIKNFAN